ncbi:MAG TPA: hypothetical protein PKD37_03825 [Oligoflexia bacterium]|nr:hypothetical protein [Oligoflexia bacterium]HMP27096.1 hypothetical protein [Oligoflexia bacterium]
MGIIFALAGPSGAGKTTLGQRLLAEFKGSLVANVSYTSRAPRPGEVNGESYFFISREDFQKKIAAGEFYEFEENHNSFYGTGKQEIERALLATSDLLLTLDIRGTLNFKRKFPESVVVVGIFPPSAEEMWKRVLSRAGGDLADGNVRFQTALNELKIFKENIGLVDFIFANENFESSYETLKGILLSERVRRARNQERVLKTWEESYAKHRS